MTKQEFDQIIFDLVAKGIEITMKMDKSNMVYDLNTNMKSHLYLHWDIDNNCCICWGRYGHEAIVYDYKNLLLEVKNCIKDRDFGNPNWLDLLVKEGVLEIVEKVTTTRTFK